MDAPEPRRDDLYLSEGSEAGESVPPPSVPDTGSAGLGDLLLSESAQATRDLPQPAPERPPPRVPPGGILAERFRVLNELGAGAMGVVYRAQDLASGKEVALKLLKQRGDPRKLERFRREGTITAGLRHPGIVQVHFAGEIEGFPFLAYELVPGARTLGDAAEGADPEDVVRLVRDAARALGYAHREGVLHRDVKPDNILVDGRGRVRVADFGLAAAEGLERITRTGTSVGTPMFMAPEQLRGKRHLFAPALDTWALATTLYYLLSGRFPFPATNLRELAKRTQSPPVPLRRVLPAGLARSLPGLVAGLDAACARALQRDPAARTPDGQAFADELDAVLRGDIARPPPRALLGRRGHLLLGLGGTLLLGGALAVGLAQREPPAPELRWSSPQAQGGRVALRGVVFDAASGDQVRVGERVAVVDAAGHFVLELELSDGAQQIEAEVIRAGEVVARAQRALSIDARPPQLRLEAPAEGARTVKQRLHVRGSAHDRGGVARVRVQGLPQQLDARQGFSQEIELQPGENVLRVEAVDAAGNRAELERTVWRVPEWYAELPSRRQAPLPLPGGLVFGEEPGEYLHPADGSRLVWVWVPDGSDPREFQMADFVRFTRGYFLGKHEVSWGQYRRFCLATGRSYRKPGHPVDLDHPVHYVSWMDASAYCAWAGLRLPSEAEWEHAARSVDARPYPWGSLEEAATLGNFKGAGDGFAKSSPIGSFPAGASPFGCLDLLGNVYEWTRDWHGPRVRVGTLLVDPQGPSSGTKRVVKGGSFADLLVKPTRRWSNAPSDQKSTIGFRVARGLD